MPTTHIPDDLLAIYQGSVYRVDGTASQPEFLLRLQQFCPELERLHTLHEVECSCFVTAYNPRSRARTEPENRAAQEQLLQLVRRNGWVWFAGSGEDPDGHCAAEPCLLVLGVSHTRARELGAEFDQNALLWAGSDACPQLLLVR